MYPEEKYKKDGIIKANGIYLNCAGLKQFTEMTDALFNIIKCSDKHIW